MKTPPWLKRSKNDHEASGSSSQRSRLSAFLRDTSLPPPPRPEEFWSEPMGDYQPPRDRRTRLYYRVGECKRRWREGRGIQHTDVSLPTDWHFNRDRVPVLPPPKAGRGLAEVIRRWISNLPRIQWWERGYHSEAYWIKFLEWEHNVRRATTIRRDLQPGEVDDWILASTTRLLQYL